jgi:hypothetical protein
VALTMDADIAGGLFVKGYVLNAVQFKDFDAVCSKGNLINVVRTVKCTGVCVYVCVSWCWG